MDIEKRARAFRAEVARRRGLGPRARYTPELRAEALAYVRERMATGARPEVVSRELGLGRYTLRRWLSAAEAPTVFRAVKIAEDAERTDAPGLVVHGPCGLRIEVRDVSALAALLRSLA